MQGALSVTIVRTTKSGRESGEREREIEGERERKRGVCHRGRQGEEQEENQGRKRALVKVWDTITKTQPRATFYLCIS